MIKRAAKEMVAYLDKLQEPNGLFYHAPDVPFFWGRGNGWMAAGMSELLLSLPKDNPDRVRILEGYRKMMATLKQTQDETGMWLQLVDDPKSWAESSCTGMFTFALITGVKQGWLNPDAYGPIFKQRFGPHLPCWSSLNIELERGIYSASPNLTLRNRTTPRLQPFRAGFSIRSLFWTVTSIQGVLEVGSQTRREFGRNVEAVDA